MSSDDKASEIVKSITAEQLEKTRSEVQAEVDGARDEEADTTDDGLDLESKDDARVAKLDLIQDMQIILIDKYRNAAKLLVAALVVMVLILAAQILQFSRSLSLSGKVIVIAEQQSAMVKAQQEAAKDAAKGVEKIRVAVVRTEEKVEEAVEAAPKLEVDPDSGKVTKVIVPVKRPKMSAGSKKAPKDGEPKQPAPPPVHVFELK